VNPHLERDLDGLRRHLLNVSALVEDALRRAILAFVYRRHDFAQAIIDDDAKIDELEVAVEEECLKILALHRPDGDPLRFVIAMLKVNNDLERMGDLAANIARRTAALEKSAVLDPPMGLRRMAEIVGTMVRRAIDALVHGDADGARAVCAADDEVDDLNRKLFAALQLYMQSDPSNVPWAMQTLSVSRHLERIADLSTNIAEDVVFMVEGDIIRHRADGHVPRLERPASRLPAIAAEVDWTLPGDDEAVSD